MSKSMYFFAIGPTCWGRGMTEEQAVKNCWREWPSNSRPNKPDRSRCVIFKTADPDAYVNEMGGLTYARSIGCELIHEPAPRQ